MLEVRNATHTISPPSLTPTLTLTPHQKEGDTQTNKQTNNQTNNQTKKKSDEVNAGNIRDVPIKCAFARTSLAFEIIHHDVGIVPERIGGEKDLPARLFEGAKHGDEVGVVDDVSACGRWGK